MNCFRQYKTKNWIRNQFLLRALNEGEYLKTFTCEGSQLRSLGILFSFYQLKRCKGPSYFGENKIIFLRWF